MAGDPFSTARSMFLMEFGCPPLPMLAKHHETDTSIVASTHDLLSTFLITTFRRQDQRANQRRRILQSQLEEVYYSKLMRCEDFNEAYQLMVNYTRGYLSTYLDPAGPLSSGDFQILDSDYASPSIVHEIRGYLKGMRILTNIDSAEDDECLAQQSVKSLLMGCIRCAVHQKKQRAVGVPVLECMSESVDEEREEPDALESGVKVF